MRVESRIFELLTIFFFVVGTIYLVISREPAGSAALFLTGGLSLIVGTYFRFVARRLEAPRPEDNPGGEISDGAGDVGFFSPGSYWPILLAGAVALTGISLAFMYFWAVAISAILIVMAVGGLLFEYHIRPSDH
jgi:cytochrome c oxidase subunit IV